jgi:hypothetical protein
MIELYLGDRVISFDGRVIESFGGSQAGSERYHIAEVKAAELRVDKKGRYSVFIQMKGRGYVGTEWLAAPEAIEQAQQLVAEVERARASL